MVCSAPSIVATLGGVLQCTASKRPLGARGCQAGRTSPVSSHTQARSGSASVARASHSCALALSPPRLALELGEQAIDARRRLGVERGLEPAARGVPVARLHGDLGLQHQGLRVGPVQRREAGVDALLALGWRSRRGRPWRRPWRCRDAAPPSSPPRGSAAPGGAGRPAARARPARAAPGAKPGSALTARRAWVSASAARSWSRRPLASMW